MQNSPGQGDSDYRDGYQIRFRGIPSGIKVDTDYYLDKEDLNNSKLSDLKFKFTYDDFPYKEGDRIGQIFMRNSLDIHFIKTTDLEESTRSGGFGSTGS